MGFYFNLFFKGYLMAVLLDMLTTIVNIFAWFGVFAWLGFTAVLLRQVEKSPMELDQEGVLVFKNKNFSLWPKMMTFMYFSGTGLCALVCATLYHLFEPGMVVIVLGFMVLGAVYLRYSLYLTRHRSGKWPFRHGLIALLVGCGYAAGLAILLIYQPLALDFTSGGVFGSN